MDQVFLDRKYFQSISPEVENKIIEKPYANIPHTPADNTRRVRVFYQQTVSIPHASTIFLSFPSHYPSFCAQFTNCHYLQDFIAAGMWLITDLFKIIYTNIVSRAQLIYTLRRKQSDTAQTAQGALVILNNNKATSSVYI